MQLLRTKTIACATALLAGISLSAQAQTGVTPAQVRAIAKEACIYGFPMVDSYRIQHAYFVDPQNPEYTP